MSSLKAFVDSYDPTVELSYSTPESSRNIPGENYIALALVERNAMPEIGGSLTIGEGAPVVVTEANLAQCLKDLALAGKAWFFGNTTINGKKGEPKEFEEGEAYGTRTVVLPTGEVEEMVEFTIKDFYLNVTFFNSLRSQSKKLDAFLFTNKSCEVVRYDADQPVFHKIGHAKGGDVKKAIAGKLGITYTHEEGEIVPILGIDHRELDASDLAFTFAPAATLTGVTQVAGTTDHFLSPAAGGSFVLAVNETAPVQYSIFKGVGVGTAIPTADKITIDSNTGLVTILAAQPAGRSVYTAIAQNKTGIFGKFVFTLDKAAA